MPNSKQRACCTLEGELLYKFRLLENRTLMSPNQIIREALESYFGMIDLKEVSKLPIHRKNKSTGKRYRG